MLYYWGTGREGGREGRRGDERRGGERRGGEGEGRGGDSIA